MAGSALTKNAVIAVALVSAGFLAAWLRYRDALGHTAGYSDGTRVLDADEADGLRYVVWEPARVLELDAGGQGDLLHRPALSPDGRFLVGFAGERGLNADLVVCERDASGGFGAPRPLAGVNSGADELDPAFSATHLWFASDRRGGSGGLDLWRARFDGGLCGTPERIVGGVNGPHDERGPAPAPDEHALVFASNRPGHGGFDLLRATRAGGDEAWQVAFEDALCTGDDELDPALVDGGRALVFATDRPGRGGFDLVRAVWSDGAFAAPEPLAALNGPADERGPAAEADGFALVFERASDGASANGTAGLVRARSRELLRLPGRPVGWLDVVLLATLLLLALLAWLAKRWPALDVLWKCILVSLVVHLLLAWWFRYLFVEPETYELPGEGERFRVRLAAVAAPGPSGLAERGGVLEVARAAAALEAAERHAQAARALPDAAAPDVAALELAAGESAAAPPERAALDVEPRSARVAHGAELALDDAPPHQAAVAAAAPELVLVPSASAPLSPVRAAPAPERASAAARLEPGPHPSSAARPAALLADAFERDLDADAPPVPPMSAGRAQQHEQHRPERGERAALALDDAPERPARPAAAAVPELVLAPRVLAPAGAAGAALADDGPGRAPLPDASQARRPPSPLDGARPSEALALERDLAPRAELGPAPARAERGPDALRPATAGVMPRRVTLSDDAPEPARAAPARSAGTPAFDPLASLVPHADERPRARGALPDVERAVRVDEAAAPSAEPLFTPLAAVDVAAAPPARPAQDAAARWQRTPYQSRAGGEKTRAIELYGGSVETEQAVAGGLAYLARIQTPLGAWGDAGLLDDKYGQIAVGKTGLALLAFLGAGHTHGSDSEYSDVVRRGLAFLLAVQDERSGHFGRSSAYGHGIATYALGECYALTQDVKLRGPLERATDQVLAHQNKRPDPRLFGGWSYYYADDRVFDGWPRVSISAWQVMALESARLGGLVVPDMAFDDAREFLAQAKDPARDWYRYSHDPERLRSGYPTLPASTPAALFALSLLGEDLTQPAHRSAMTFVVERAPRGYRYDGDDAFVRNGQGNVYFWYYGTLATFRAGGRAWELWNEAMKETLVPAQEADGSWRPLDIYARSYARDDDRDRSYTTAMCVLSLEVYYRYYLPLLKVR